jgi:hypothetical protein
MFWFKNVKIVQFWKLFFFKIVQILKKFGYFLRKHKKAETQKSGQII